MCRPTGIITMFTEPYMVRALVAAMLLPGAMTAHLASPTGLEYEATSSEDGDPAHVFEVAEESRADGVGSMIATFAAGFAAVKAAKQIARTNDVTPVKTWVTGRNPRPEHAAMNGETCPVDEPFSNGNDWPGGLPGCNCSVSISIP